jgi:catechol 2,3-dioxygenase-like lactoylglutathione lyase family enzyme
MTENKEYPIPYKTDQCYFSYNVKDYDRAKEFYTEVLGLEVTWDGGTEVGWVEFALPVSGARLGLNILSEGEVKVGSGTLVPVVHDLETTKKYLDDKGIKTDDIVDVPDMVSWFNVKDPDGNIIQFVADPRVKSE